MFLIFRETSAQHFSDRVGGSFHNEKSSIYSDTNRYCCNLDSNKNNIPLGKWSDDLLLIALNTIDLNWRKYLDWLPFYEMTNSLYDLHVEGNPFGKADCTHFVYIPFIFYPLWSHLFNIIKYRLSLPLESVSDFMANVALKNGTLLKGTSLAVYYIENGKRRIFNDWGIFLKLGLKPYNIHHIPDKELNVIPMGDPM